MVSAEYTEKLALFYYFLFLDENKAQSLTAATLKTIRHEQLKLKIKRELSPKDFIRLTSQFVSTQKRKVKPTSFAFSTGYIVLPESSNWGPWFEFRKQARDSEFRAVLYTKILKFSEGDVAEGLGVSEGTVRYRIGRGLKLLGQIGQLGSAYAH